jgi:hypothetical protein
VSEPTATVQARIPASLRATVEERLDAAAQERVAERLRAGDATLWALAGTPDPVGALRALTATIKEQK